jgi:hypothetical protein
MSVPKTDALPLGDCPATRSIIARMAFQVKSCVQLFLGFARYPRKPKKTRGLREELGVGFFVFSPFFGEIFLRKNGFHGTNRDASTAVDTLVWVDVVAVRSFTGVDAVDGANFYA